MQHGERGRGCVIIAIRDVGHSFVDLEQGIFYRLALGRRASNKRQPPALVPSRLLAHMRRWVCRGVVSSHFVEWPRRAGEIGQDSIQSSCEPGWPVGPGYTAHPSSHCRDLAHAARRTDLVGRWLPRHVGRNLGADLRTSSSGLHADRREGYHNETTAETIIGCFIG